MISRTCPGKQNMVTTRTPEGKFKMQKRHLYANIKEGYSLFMEKNPGVKKGLSKFAILQPNQGILTSQTPANIGKLLSSIILALGVLHTHIPSVPVNNKDSPACCMVSSETDSCWYNECKHLACSFESSYSLPDDDMLK